MMKFIKIIAASIVTVFVFTISTVFALDEDLVFNSVFECRGTVYFVDPSTQTAVLKNLEYSDISDAELKTDIRYLVEYSEIPIFMGGISAADRGRISGETVNSEYADAKVRALIAKNGKGYKIIYMICGVK